jgi:transposase
VAGVFCPTLRQGDIVIMENLAPHKCGATLKLIEAAGAKDVFLPAYSPDFNPIEKMWSKVKSTLRSIEVNLPRFRGQGERSHQRKDCHHASNSSPIRQQLSSASCRPAA